MINSCDNYLDTYRTRTGTDRLHSLFEPFEFLPG